MAEGEIAIKKSIKNATNSGVNTSSASAGAGANSVVADKLKKITALFFDLDNTLIPTRSGDSKAAKKLAEVLENQFGFSKEESGIATQTFLKAFRRCPDNSQTSLDSWRTYLWREALPARYKHLAEQIYPLWLQLRYRYLALSADYVHMLRCFRASNFLLALITNGPSNAQWEKINRLHVSQYFDCVFVSSDLPWEKPNPNIFHAACNFLGVRPAQCVMIGDKLESDIKGGRLAKLGATFWLPLHGAETDLSDVPHQPDILLKQLLDIYKYFPTVHVARNISTNSNNTMFTTNAMAANTSSALAAGSGGAAAHYRRRGSQISHSRTTSTCYSDLHRRPPLQYQAMQVEQESQAEWYYGRENYVYEHEQYRQRRGGSLPAIECLNSEAENSTDSLFD